MITLLSGVEYIKFDPLNPTLGVANVISYINYQIKLKKQRNFDVGVGLGIVGVASLIFYSLYKLGKNNIIIDLNFIRLIVS